MTETRSGALDALHEDGDTVELEDGRVLRLRVTPDEGSVMDLWSEDSYGKIEPVDDRTDDYGHPRPRPAGFDGRAEKISYDRGEQAWWQPPADVEQGSDVFRSIRNTVRDLLEFGFYSVGLELLEGKDAYGRPIVANAAWLGGLEPQDYAAWQDTLRNDVLPDLLYELGFTDPLAINRDVLGF